ncbi:MAG: hypothetical protein QXE10_06405 [Desulfurococcaceae archaeon]
MYTWFLTIEDRGIEYFLLGSCSLHIWINIGASTSPSIIEI